MLENSSVTLECNATGNPIPEIRFAKEGKTVAPTKRSQVIRFPRIHRTDSGRYRCNASNGIGNITERTITLAIDVQCKYTDSGCTKCYMTYRAMGLVR